MKRHMSKGCLFVCWQRCVRSVVAVVQSLLILASLRHWFVWLKHMQGWGSQRKLKMSMWRKPEGMLISKWRLFKINILVGDFLLVLLCESEKREHFETTLGFSFQNLVFFACIYFIVIFGKLFCKKCKFEFSDYSTCGLIMSKLNHSVHAFLIRTVKVSP